MAGDGGRSKGDKGQRCCYLPIQKRAAVHQQLHLNGSLYPSSPAHPSSTDRDIHEEVLRAAIVHVDPPALPAGHQGPGPGAVVVAVHLHMAARVTWTKIALVVPAIFWEPNLQNSIYKSIREK